MGRDQRPGDWAAWMTGPAGAAATPSSAPMLARDADVTRDPDPEPERGSDPASAPAPGREPSGEGTRTPRREATRQRLLDAARAVFAERGVTASSVEDICERAGFTRGAFYSNFADREDVIAALVEREQDRLMDHVNSIFADLEREIASATELGSVLKAIIDRILLAVPFDRDLSLLHAELENLAIRRPDEATRFLAINQRFRRRVTGFIADAMRRNGRELLVDASILTDAVIALTQRSVRQSLLDGDGADPNSMASAILPGLLLAFSRAQGEPVRP